MIKVIYPEVKSLPIRSAFMVYGDNKAEVFMVVDPQSSCLGPETQAAMQNGKRVLAFGLSSIRLSMFGSCTPVIPVNINIGIESTYAESEL